MQRYKLTVEYHGGPFVGWQRQATGLSVQGAIEAALDRAAPRSPTQHRVQGAGRTDAGVHAKGQVAHCDLTEPWEPHRLAEALNHHLRPLPIAILGVEPVAASFHARFDAVQRCYLYRILCRRAPLTLDHGLAWQVRHALDVGAMQAAADLLVGRHDFTTFRSSQCQAASPIKTLDRFEITHRDREIQCRLEARSFLHHQVRSMVGTVERVAAGRWTMATLERALRARDRVRCGPVAPAEGLYLTAVRYPGGEPAR